MSFFYFAITIWSLSCSIENILKNPSKASACSQMPCPSVFRLKDWTWEFFSRRLESFSRIGILPILGELVFLKDIFRLKHFHNAYPSAGMPMGRAFAEWLKEFLKEGIQAFRHVDAVMEKTTGQILKSSCSFNENVLFFF